MKHDEQFNFVQPTVTFHRRFRIELKEIKRFQRAIEICKGFYYRLFNTCQHTFQQQNDEVRKMNFYCYYMLRVTQNNDYMYVVRK